MKISKYTFILLFFVVVTSLGVLLYNQYRILERDLEINKNVMTMAVPDILSDLYDNSMYNDDLRNLVSDIRGTGSFAFANTSELTDPLQLKLKTEIDKVLALNYPNFDYRVDGYTSSEYGCMIHRGNWPVQPQAKNVMEADNHLCFCMIYPKKLDIAMTYTNKEAAVLGESADIIRNSLLLIIVILGAFGYTIYTINRQKKLSDLKRDFINNLTHEFKTPIFSISLAAKSLKEKEEIKTSEKMSSYVNLVSTETKRLQTQVDKILQMALLDSGNLHLEKKTLDLHELISQVAESFAMIIAEKQGEIKLSLQAKRHLITADETHIKNVLYNLIDNAQKYTDGAPRIDITTADTEQND
ncbi:MAG: HAMP domain-containing sensor histidine kinase, partial [Imperialibacter sp.]